jgi:flagellar biosynthesis/type III secretory pathway protein FliH
MVRKELMEARAENEALVRQRDELLKDQGADEQRIADLEKQLQDAETKAHEAEAEAALNVENLEEELVEVKKDVAYNDGLADGRREAMDLFKNIIMNIGTAIRPLAGPSLGELLKPLVPDTDRVAENVARAVFMSKIAEGIARARAHNGGKNNPDEDPDDQVGD